MQNFHHIHGERLAKILNVCKVFIFLLPALVIACAATPAVTTSFDEMCEVVENPIYEISFSRSTAIKRLKEHTLALEGDTLLLGRRGLKEIYDYEEQLERERILSLPEEERVYEIGTPIPVGVRIPEAGQTVYWGAVLNCHIEAESGRERHE